MRPLPAPRGRTPRGLATGRPAQRGGPRPGWPEGAPVSDQREYFVVCTLGLEAAVAGELQALGARDIAIGRGGVTCHGDRRLGYAMNLWLRAAIRVQDLLLRARASTPAELYRAVRGVDWGPLLTPQQTLAVDATVSSQWMTHSGYAAQVVKDAIVDHLREQHGVRPDVDREHPDLPLKLVLREEEVILYRNLSGPSLHKRGWRRVQVKSPLNEATAAGLLLLSEWDRRSPLVDPMCGSGTFLIEAAHLAMDRAPGLLRRFPFERWPDFDPVAWSELRAEARARMRAEPGVELTGFDRHPGAIAIARGSAEAAGVAPFVRLTQTAANDVRLEQPPGMVVVNPPYGERLGSDETELYDSWRQLARFLHEECAGAVAWVLSGNPELTRILRLKTSRKVPVRNGTIDCRWLRYEIR
jgi:putative N6-adenine-specific DNA methylase